MYDLVLKEGMWHEIAFSEGKRRRSFFQVAVSGWEKQRNGYRMGSGDCRESGPPEKSVVPSTRSEEHTSELQYQLISYAVFCLKKKKKKKKKLEIRKKEKDKKEKKLVEIMQ